MGDDGNFSAIRVVRVLRPLRTIQSIPGLKKIISALGAAGPDLGYVSLLFGFVIFLFSIIGVQLFSGVLQQHCHDALGNMTDPGTCVCCVTVMRAVLYFVLCALLLCVVECV